MSSPLGFSSSKLIYNEHKSGNLWECKIIIEHYNLPSFLVLPNEIRIRKHFSTLLIEPIRGKCKSVMHLLCFELSGVCELYLNALHSLEQTSFDVRILEHIPGEEQNSPWNDSDSHLRRQWKLHAWRSPNKSFRFRSRLAPLAISFFFGHTEPEVMKI